jgi:F0F1-type ATP synthase alpha subunit
MQLKPEEISKLIKEQIKNYENQITQTDTGTIGGELRIGAIIHGGDVLVIGHVQLLLKAVLEIVGAQTGLRIEVTHDTGSTIGVAQLAVQEVPDGLFGVTRIRGFRRIFLFSNPAGFYGILLQR